MKCLILFLSFIHYSTSQPQRQQKAISFGLRGQTYDCKTGVGSACQWNNYTENVDWGYYSEFNGDCSWCQAQCSKDRNCWAVECGKGYCSWWKNGQCSIEDAVNAEEYNANYNTCRSVSQRRQPDRGGRVLTTTQDNSGAVCNYKCGSRDGECQHEYRSQNGLFIIGNCVAHDNDDVIQNGPRCLGVHPQCSKCVDKCAGLQGLSISEAPKPSPREGRLLESEPARLAEPTRLAEPALYGSDPTKSSEPALYGR